MGGGQGDGVTERRDLSSIAHSIRAYIVMAVGKRAGEFVVYHERIHSWDISLENKLFLQNQRKEDRDSIIEGKRKGMFLLRTDSRSCILNRLEFIGS